MKQKSSSIKEIINQAKKGKMFILVDNKDRENEGDLVVPGSKINSKKINFMAKHGRGLICLALSNEKVKKLKLPLMSSVNKSRTQTAFTVSIEAKKGISTGISAEDRAKTIKIAIKNSSTSKDIVSPGHVFPLVCKDGGVLERAGHTEASVDISKLAKLNPSAVICEVMNEDGTMARYNDLVPFSKKHKLKIAKIEDLISYRLKNEKFIKIISTKKIFDSKFLSFDTKMDKAINSLLNVLLRENEVFNEQYFGLESLLGTHIFKKIKLSGSGSAMFIQDPEKMEINLICNKIENSFRVFQVKALEYYH